MKNEEVIFIDGEETFRKSTSRSRCRIAGANGIILLSIPLFGGRGVKEKMRDVKISDAEPWQQQHWKSIRTAYGKSSFFLFYEDRFRPFYETRFEWLMDFNTQLLQLCFEILHWEKKISMEPVVPAFSRSGIGHPPSAIKNPKPYRQVFGERHGFIADLSIVDLIFNEGNETGRFLAG